MAEQQALRIAAVLLAAATLAAGCSVAVEIPATASAAPVPTIEAPTTEAPTIEGPSTALPGTESTNIDEAEPTAEPTQDPGPASDEPEEQLPEVATFGFPVSDEWPESIREYVDFVQETRGEEFVSVSSVRFADPVVLVAEFQLDFFSFDDLDGETQALVLRLDDMYRALGLANEEFNILDARSDVVGDVAAFYDWRNDEIVFPSPDGEYLDTIPLRDRPVLVHELGHALQADSRIGWANRLEDPALSAAMLEGEAEWLFDQYLRSLTDAEWLAWNESLPEFEDPGDLPEILQIEFASSYALGSRFFHARYATGGLQGIDQVFRSRPWAVTTQMLLDPWLYTGDRVDQETFGYELPAIRGSGTPVDVAFDFPTSAVDWHQILAAALPADMAFVAARGINSYTLPRGWIDADDRLCFAIEASASPGHETEVGEALRRWSEITGVERWFEITDRGFSVGGCDPGPGNVPAPRATPGEILGEAVYVLDTETWAVEQGLDQRVGFCAAWELVGLIEASPPEELDDVYYSWFDSLDAATLPTDC